MLHCKERQAVSSFSQLIDRQNIWVAKARYRHSFASEPADRVARISVNGQDAFQSDDALRVSLARSINHAHSATPDFLKDLVIADAPTRAPNIYFLQHGVPIRRILPIVLPALVEDST